MEDPKEIKDWVKISHLGEGGFGLVTLWENKRTKEYIAVKKCKHKDPRLLSERQKERWTSEVHMMKNIKHENIVSFKVLPEVLDIALSRNNPTKLPILSMEYCSKGNLRHALSRNENLCGFPESEAKIVLSDIAKAISYLHSLNITHRDLKPENIVLQTCDNRPKKTIYKVIDLGYAKELSSEIASFVGTFLYLAPEIFMKSKYDKTVDYWSLGIVVFEVLTGIHPFVPYASLPIRIECIKKKRPEEIYIYYNEQEELKYSSKIPKQARMNSCLKEYMEKWLRQVLQLESEKRGSVNGKNVFNELLDILQKKIVRVYSVYNYEFFYYEIDESTQLSTLQSWFARDTKIAVEDQLVLSRKIGLEHKEDLTVAECINNDEQPTLYIFKKFYAIVDNNTPSIPPNVVLLFKCKNYNKNFTKLMTAHSLFFIWQEATLIRNLFKAMEMLDLYIKKLFVKELDENNIVKTYANKTLIEVMCYKKLDDNITKKYGTENMDILKCLKEYKEKLDVLKNNVADVNILCQKHEKLKVRMKMLMAKSKDVSKILNDSLMDQLYSEALLDAKINAFESNSCLKYVTEALKKRDIPLRKSGKETLEVFINCMWTMYIKCWKVLNNLNTCKDAIQNLSTVLYDIQAEKFEAMCKSTKKDNDLTPVLSSLGSSSLDIPFDSIIQENINLRYTIQEELDKSLTLHKSINEELSSLSIESEDVIHDIV